jgi:dUTPase
VANVIDSGYTGECHAVIYKMGGPVEIHKAGEKIAQMVVFPCWTGQPVQVEKINMKTSRGEGKLGSTGLT